MRRRSNHVFKSEIASSPAFRDSPLRGQSLQRVPRNDEENLCSSVSERAFTLVEILVALAILLIGIVVMLNLFPLGWQSFTYARRLNGVALLAEKKFEEFKLQKEFKDASGSEQGFNWAIKTQAIKLLENVEVVCAQLDIDFDYQGKKLSERFVTYASND